MKSLDRMGEDTARKRALNVAVYCSSRADLGLEYEQTAADAGRIIGQRGHTLVYGGVNAGMMHIAAQAAHDAGARVVGVVPQFFSHRADPLLDQTIITRDLSDRKAAMIAMADVFVALPGGLGTIDEWISTLSALVVAQDRSKPIVVANIGGIFDHMVSQIAATALSPFARGKGIDMSIVVGSRQQLIDTLNEIL